MAETAALLVDEVLPHKPIRQWVLSFPYPLRFLLARDSQALSGVLGIVIRAISTHLIKKAGFRKSEAHTGAVTLIQRFGSALNLNVHFHMLFIDGVYRTKSDGALRFYHLNAPTSQELNALVLKISHRVARYLERKGLITRDEQSSHLSLELHDDDAMNQLQGHSITYRIAIGAHRGRKVFTLQTIPSIDEDELCGTQLGNVSGFSLHAGVSTKSREGKKLERLCRYIARPAVSEKRLSLTSNGQVKYQLKTPYRDGTTHVLFEPLDFMAKLAALIPRARVNLTRFHGVLAPNSQHRSQVTPAKRGKGSGESVEKGESTEDQNKHKPMSWAQRLKRVFAIDITVCSQCGGVVRVVASIEDPQVIKRILRHLENKAASLVQSHCMEEQPRAPPPNAMPYP